MKNKLFAAAMAALTLGLALPAAAQNYRYGDLGGQPRYDQRGDFRRNLDITIRKDGRNITFERGDRMFYRLLDRPYNFRPGMTYVYTDRCNRNGCVAFVYDGRHRRPVDRIFAPRLPDRRFAWREARDFDRDYNRYGDYDRNDRNDRWNGEYDRMNRDWRADQNDDDDRWDDRDDRDGRRGGRELEGGPRPYNR